MAFDGFTSISFEDSRLQLMQDIFARFISRFENDLFYEGKIIEEVSLVSGDNEIYHGIGRIPRGWFVVDIDASVDIYRSSWDEDKIVLNSSGTAEIKLRIF